MKQKVIISVVAIVFVLLGSQSFAAEEVRHKPFILAKIVSGVSMDKLANKVRRQLTAGGFEVVGTYEPYPKARIYIVTNKELKRIAAGTEYGGFGAVLKVSLWESEKGIQISYNNPTYIGLAYNMGSRLEKVKAGLKRSVGFTRYFGGGEGIRESKLPGYHYTFGLEDFYGFMPLGEFSSFKQALRKVETGLAKGTYGIKKVFRVDIPGKKEALFGVSLNADVKKQPYLNDKFVMEVIDSKELKRLPHLPYEILVKGSKVIALHPHYRLAVNFPEMRMFGPHSFGKLMDLPSVYEEYFRKAVGGTWPPPIRHY